MREGNRLPLKSAAAVILAVLSWGGPLYVVSAWAATHTANLRTEVAGTPVVSGSSILVFGQLPSGEHAGEVLTESGGRWRHQATLPAGNAECCSSATGAFDGDTALVGIPYGGERDNGEVYVFARSGDAWSRQARLTVQVSDQQVGFGFGTSVAVSGDTAFVTAPSSGLLAYVFERDGSRWRQTGALRTPDGATAASMAVDGDTAVFAVAGIGGAVYVFVRGQSGWTRQAKLTAPAGIRLAGPVDISGDRIIAGGVPSVNQPHLSGGNYIFVRQGEAWHRQVRLRRPRSVVPYDHFGSAVAIAGNRALVGASDSADEGFGMGSAYLYVEHGGRWILQSTLFSSDRFGGSFGREISMDGDTAAFGGGGYVFSLLPRPFLECPGDVDGDGRPDLTVVTPDGNTVTKALDDSKVSRFAFGGFSDIADTAVMRDSDANGAPELVAVDRTSSRAVVRDLLSGGVMTSTPLDPYPRPLEVLAAPDVTGNRTQEVATLAWRPIRVEVDDAQTGVDVARIDYFGRFGAYFNVRNAVIYPDLNGNRAPEAAVLADNKNPENADELEIRDLATGSKVRSIWFGSDCGANEYACHNLISSRQTVVADLNGNGYPEFAVLRIHSMRSRLQRGQDPVYVELRDGKTGQFLGHIPLDPSYPPTRLLTVPDATGNGADELLTFARRDGVGNQKAVITDSRTGRIVRTMYFDQNAPMQDLAISPDSNGNGAAEVVMLGRRSKNDELKAIVKDTRSGERLSVVHF